MQNQTAFGAAVGFSVATVFFSAPLFFKLFRRDSSKKTTTLRCLGFEMGGTTCKVATGEKTLNENGKVISVKIITKFTVKTKDDPEETVQSLIDCVMNAVYEEVGIAHFGPLELDPEKSDFGKIASTPKLRWSDFRALAVFKSKMPTRAKRTTIDTDVNAAALAEFYLGGHKVRQSLAYITVGTGVGVGLVIDGKPVHGLIHPEGGHTSVIPHEFDKDYKGSCKNHGKYCVEVVANNVSIAERRGIDKEEIHTLNDDDKIWEVVGFYLGNLCANILMMTSPEVIILGGGVMQRKVIYPYVLKSFTEALNGYLVHPKLTSNLTYLFFYIET